MTTRSRVIAAMTAWDAALEGGTLAPGAGETLNLTIVRDLLVACAADSTARALSGAEALGAVQAGTAVLCGHPASDDDAEWFAGTMIGEGVVSESRVERLRELCRDLWEAYGMASPARENAGVLWGWAAWQTGNLAEARGALAAVLDTDPGHEAAVLLLQVIDVQRQG